MIGGVIQAYARGSPVVMASETKASPSIVREERSSGRVVTAVVVNAKGKQHGRRSGKQGINLFERDDLWIRHEEKRDRHHLGRYFILVITVFVRIIISGDDREIGSSQMQV
jgi:hypothetical protein